jgi:hypothetical protein
MACPSAPEARNNAPFGEAYLPGSVASSSSNHLEAEINVQRRAVLAKERADRTDVASALGAAHRHVVPRAHSGSLRRTFLEFVKNSLRHLEDSLPFAKNSLPFDPFLPIMSREFCRKSLRQLHKIGCEWSGCGPRRKRSLRNSLRAGKRALQV